MTENQEKTNNGHWMYKEIVTVYEKYNITNEEDPLVCTFGMDPAEAKRRIIENTTPERAKELLKAEEELRKITEKFVDNFKKQFDDFSKEQIQHSILRHDYELDALQESGRKDFCQMLEGQKRVSTEVVSKSKGKLRITPRNQRKKRKENTDLLKILNGAGVSVKKLWVYISWLVTAPFEASNIINLPWIDYAEKSGIDTTNVKALEKFKDDIYDDLTFLYNVSLVHDDMNTRIITKYTTIEAAKDCFKIVLSDEVVEALRAGAVVYFDNVLYSLSNSDPNAFSIAFKISIHFYNKSNITNKSNKSLSVASLLQYAPELRSIEDYRATGQRTWKRDLKKPLEKALNEITKIGFLKSWNYKLGKKKLTAEESEKLERSDFEKLIVEYSLKNVSKKALEALKNEETKE